LDFFQGSLWSNKDLKQKKVPSSKEILEIFSQNNQGSRGLMIGNSNKDFLGKKIKGLHGSLMFEDHGIIELEGCLKIGGFGVIT